MIGELIGAEVMVEIPRDDAREGVPHYRRGGVDSVWAREIGSGLDDSPHRREDGAALGAVRPRTYLTRNGSESKAQGPAIARSLVVPEKETLPRWRSPY